jgi:tetratricopeptide (TPR) repeat protein
MDLLSADLYSNWGTAYFSLGEMNKAIECYKAAIEIAPDHKEALYNLGLAYDIVRGHKSALGNKKKPR